MPTNIPNSFKINPNFEIFNLLTFVMTIFYTIIELLYSVKFSIVKVSASSK